MPAVLGTKVTASFFTFGSTPPPGPNDPQQHPPIYYGSSEGTLTLASVNAGNSKGLDVGGGGVNHQFDLDLGTGPGGAARSTSTAARMTMRAGITNYWRRRATAARPVRATKPPTLPFSPTSKRRW